MKNDSWDTEHTKPTKLILKLEESIHNFIFHIIKNKIAYFRFAIRLLTFLFSLILLTFYFVFSSTQKNRSRPCDEKELEGCQNGPEGAGYYQAGYRIDDDE